MIAVATRVSMQVAVSAEDSFKRCLVKGSRRLFDGLKPQTDITYPKESNVRSLDHTALLPRRILEPDGGLRV